MNQNLFAILFVVLGFFSGSHNLVAVTSSVQARTEPYSPGSYEVSAIHYTGFRDEVDPLTSMILSGSWKVRDFTAFVSQPAVKYYRILKGDQQVELSDTIVGSTYNLPSVGYGIESKATFSLTVPVSQFSRQQDIITKPKISLLNQKTFFNSSLVYILTPTFRYHLNRYKTTQSELGAGGGNPLRQFEWTIDQTLGYEFLPNLNLTAYLSYVQIFYHELGYKNRVRTSAQDFLLSEDYSFNLALNFKVTDSLTLSAGYDQSDTVERTFGVQEFYLFDTYNSQWFMGAAAVF